MTCQHHIRYAYTFIFLVQWSLQLLAELDKLVRAVVVEMHIILLVDFVDKPLPAVRFLK